MKPRLCHKVDDPHYCNQVTIGIGQLRPQTHTSCGTILRIKYILGLWNYPVSDDLEGKPPDSVPNCKKCGTPTNLVTVIGRLGKIPTYWVFQCDACTAPQWVAEQITGNDVSG